MGRCSFYAPISPADILGGSVNELVAKRFVSERRALILQDLAREDEVLRKYVENARLDLWFEDLLVLCDGVGSQKDSIALGHDEESESAAEPVSNLAKPEEAKGRLSWV